VLACTPHILPGLYHNTGPQIRAATLDLQRVIDQEGIPLRLVTGPMCTWFQPSWRTSNGPSAHPGRFPICAGGTPASHRAASAGGLLLQFVSCGILSDPHPPGTPVMGSIAVRNHPKTGARGSLDAGYRRLPDWRIRPNCAILGMPDAGRGLSSYFSDGRP
jgi:hypothetical protein